VPHYVLITGERGTGKTTIARKLHEKSTRNQREFVNLNCASLTQELLESELFGYEKGAFTGASAPKAGLFEIAGGGTLFLDEIGEIPLTLQAKLLKAVEEKRIRRVGSNAEREVDTRIIAATSQNLKQAVAEGRFRADLYDRLNILNLETVPLRFQKEKIRDLTIRGLEKERLFVGRNRPFEISDEAIRMLENYDWFGNFRELLNFATRLAVECIDDSVISAETVRRILVERNDTTILEENTESLPMPNNIIHHNFQPITDDLITVSFDPKTDDLKIIYLKAAGKVIQHVLSENDNNLRRAASKMGTTHSTLSRIMKKFKSINEPQNFQTPLPATRSFAAAA
jgi:transcriptional regulator with PAS, ATPase and Fis domain